MRFNGLGESVLTVIQCAKDLSGAVDLDIYAFCELFSVLNAGGSVQILNGKVVFPDEYQKIARK